MQREGPVPVRKDGNHLQRVLLLGAWLLGVLVLARTAVIISAIGQFGWQIAHLPFAWAVRHSMAIAWSCSALICVLALACLFMVRIQWTLWALAAVLLTVFGVAYFADSCDCTEGLRSPFFEWAQRITPALTIYACALALVGKRHLLSTEGRAKRGIAGLMASVALFAVTLSAAGGQSAQVTAPSSGPYLRIYMSATCPHCLKSAPLVHQLKDDPALGAVAVFMGANSQSEIDHYFSQANLQFEYVAMTLAQLREVAPSVPASELIAGGKVVAQWHDRVPSPQEVRDELSKSGHSVAVKQ